MAKDVFEVLDASIALHQDMVGTMTKLKQAIRMAALLGRKPNEIKVPMRHHVIRESNHHPWSNATYVLQVEGEPEQRFKLTDVHQDLWPDDIRTKHWRYTKHMEKK